MKRILLILLAVILFVNSISLADSCEEKIIYFIGDSITTGRYPFFTKSMVDGRSSIYVFAKIGANTHTIDNILSVILSLDTIPKPTHVVIYGGINDCSGMRNLEVYGNRAKSNIEKMMSRIKNANARPILIKPHMDNVCTDVISKWMDGLGDDVDVITLRVNSSVHLNTKSEKKMALLIADKINGNGSI